MTQEEKELLLRDLSARLPYGVICHWRIGSELTLNLTEYNGQLTCINKVEIEDSSDYYYDCYFNVCNDSNGNSFQNEDVSIEIVKPYLRPISSMTEEEKDELHDWGWEYTGNDIITGGSTDADNFYKRYEKNLYDLKWLADWLNTHYFDYRGLIEKGLALEAPERMYN